jgi:hypothetical protein
MSERKGDVNGAAYDINGMLKAYILACDPMSTMAEWNGDNRIERTQLVAERMMGDLIEQIEALEGRANKAG